MIRDHLRRIFGAILLLAAVALLAAPASMPARHWAFLDARLPADLDARGGPWSMEDHVTATGARALVSAEGAAPAVLVARSPTLRDFAAVTRCKSDCGLVFRYRDDAHYEVARLDPNARSVVLASVTSGKEHVLANAPVLVTPDTWQELRVDAGAGMIRVALNGRLVIEASEGAYATHGLVGLWAPAGAAYFDELSIDAVPDSVRTLELLPIIARPRG